MVGTWIILLTEYIYFSPGLGFSQDNSMCLLVLVYVAHIFSSWYMIVNVKEDLSTLVILML
jgi:hypothetical protein